MAEVTKKDLQSLQGYCNKQIADVQKEVSELKKQIADTNKQLADVYVEFKEQYSQLDKDLARQVQDHNDAVATTERLLNGLNEKISAVQSRVAKLE